MKSALRKILPLCESWKNAVSPKSISPLEKLQLKLQLLIPCFYKFAGR